MAKTGSAKGVSKPKKTLDEGFSGRIRAAMKHGGFASVPELAKAAKCTRQALYPYLSNGKSQIDSFLLFQIADACGVSVRWLFLGRGQIGRYRPLTPQEDAVLALFKALPEALQDAWFTHGEALRSLTPSTPSKQFPYKSIK